MLANLNDVLIPAKKQKSAVGHFNVVNLEMAKGVIEAAEAENVPVILGIEESQLGFLSIEEFAAIAVPLAKNAKVPVVVHFDHGVSYEKCFEALKVGFTSVDYDCSSDSFEVNEEKVKYLTAAAHALGATVEAELGHTPEASELSDGDRVSNYYTIPEQAAEYVAKTKVDVLMISAGTGHGQYSVQPKLDFKRISDIADAVDIPLAMHGGSGLSDRTYRDAISCGISKINIFTDINIAICQGAIQAVNDGVHLATEMIPYEIHSVKATAQEKIRLFKNE